jgi:hypothetical protein
VAADRWPARSLQIGHYALVSDWVWLRHEFPWLVHGFVYAVNEQCATRSRPISSDSRRTRSRNGQVEGSPIEIIAYIERVTLYEEAVANVDAWSDARWDIYGEAGTGTCS